LYDNVVVAGLWWDEEDADYIRRRSSVLIRRILTRAVREGTEPVLTVEQVEEIARRVVRESA